MGNEWTTMNSEQSIPHQMLSTKKDFSVHLQQTHLRQHESVRSHLIRVCEWREKKTWSRMLEKATWHFPHHHLKGNYAFKTVYCRINCFSLGLNWNNFLVSEIGSIPQIIMHITCKRKNIYRIEQTFPSRGQKKGFECVTICGINSE